MNRIVYAFGITCLMSAVACSAPQAPAQPGTVGDTSQPGATGDSAKPAVDSGQPKLGGVLNARVPTDFFDFDISYAGKGTNERAQGLAYDSLLAFATGPDVPFAERRLGPALAESWKVSPDGTSFTFQLRKDVKFANLAPVNGRALTAADVKWTYEYWSRTGQFKDTKLPQGQFTFMFEGLQGVTASDPYTAVVKFEEPFGPFLNYAGHILNPIVPHEIYDQDGHMQDRIVGSGPFQLDVASSQKGTLWVFKKNPTYWEPGKPYLDEVRWFVIKDDSTAAAALLTGQVHVIGDYTHGPAQTIMERNPKATVFDLGGATPVHMYMNVAFEPFKDIRIRKAIALGIDRNEMAKVQAGNPSRWAMSGANPSMFTQAEMEKLLPYDPAQAKQLVIDAGYPNGLDVPFQYPTDNGEVYILDFELLQSQLKKIGVNLVANPMPYAQYSKTKKAHEAVMHTTSKDWQADIDSYLYGSFQSKSKGNYDSINDPKLDQMLEAQRRETDLVKREELLRQTVRYINAEAYLGRALYAKSTFMFGSPVLKGFAPNDQSPYDFTSAWLDK